MHRFMNPQQQPTPKKESELTKRTRPVTKETTDNILGLSWVDQDKLDIAKKAEQEGRLPHMHLLDHTYSHVHPCSDTPIDELDFNELFYVICNYDNDRKRAGKYEMQPGIEEDESDFLLEELAYAMYLQIKDKSVAENYGKDTVPSVDIVRLIADIGKGEYLSKNSCMMDLRDIATEKWLEYDRKCQAEKDNQRRPWFG